MAKDYYYVDGHTSERVDNYCVWRVINSSGDILCKFHGPMARTAALSFCKDLRNNSTLSLTFSDYDNTKHGGIIVKE